MRSVLIAHLTSFGRSMSQADAIQQRDAELRRTAEICSAYLTALRFAAADTARDPTYLDNHLLSYLAQDFIESAHAIPLLVNQGIQNAARRELRFILEAHIKLCFVQQESYSEDIGAKLAAFATVFDSPSISVKKQVVLHLLPEADLAAFQEETGRVYGETSRYVHLSSQQIVERIGRVDAGRTAGHESAADVAAFNALLSRVLACSLVFLFHAMPSYVAGDWYVEPDGSSVEWYFAQSRFLSMLDAAFDYKFERQARLTEIQADRSKRISF